MVYFTGYFQITVPHGGKSGRKLEEGSEARAMEGGCLLACAAHFLLILRTISPGMAPPMAPTSPSVEKMPHDIARGQSGLKASAVDPSFQVIQFAAQANKTKNPRLNTLNCFSTTDIPEAFAVPS